MDTKALGIADAEGNPVTKAISAGTVLCSSASVAMSALADCQYKQVAMTADADTVKAIAINGVAYSMSSNPGAQGQTNPGPETTISAKGAQTTGAVYKFDVKADGFLYVFCKLTGNKTYWAWEDISVPASSSLIGYNIVAYKAGAEGTEYAYKLPGDESNRFAQEGNVLAADADAYLATSWKRTYVKFSDVPTVTKPEGKKDSDKVTWTLYNGDAAVKEAVDAYVAGKGLTIPEQDASKGLKDGDNIVLSAENTGTTLATPADVCKAIGAGDNWGTANAVGVIAFPVYAESETYTVNACGSKVTCNGFVFIPGATAIGRVERAANTSSAIKNITMDDLDADAPVYNLQGQRVSKNYKGVCIQNGKKFVVK